VHHINWGDVPTWLAVIAATFGGWIALRQLRQQGDVIKGEIERNKARDELLQRQLNDLYDRDRSRMREQAAAVDIEWEDWEENPGKSVVTVSNDSRGPIRKITCAIYTDDSTRIAPEYGTEMIEATYPPESRYGSPRTRYRIPAGSESMIRILRPGAMAGFVFAKAKADYPDCIAQAEFTDNQGLEWVMSSDMELDEK
jgi:hypothetical protein